MSQRSDHWDKIYVDKASEELSWWQEVPEISLDFIHIVMPDKQASIIDIGGGDSNLVDFLLREGYENITVLDISKEALERAKQRLGDDASKVNWIVSDITDFHPTTTYDLWHDRATFHFLVEKQQVDKYLANARQALNEYGIMIIGAFSTNGPKKCSGLEVKQYSEDSLTAMLSDGFEKIKCITEDHTTPSNSLQNFLFCSFRRNW